MKKLILDIDTGIDDALALAYALGSSEADVIGVVGTYGNVYTPQGVQNVLNLLETLKCTHIPVFAGEEHASSKPAFDRLDISAKIHGNNGIGEVELPLAKNSKETKHGVDFILEAVKQYGKDICVVATGPCTNIAQAIAKDASIASAIGSIVIMGGALSVPGNVTAFAEANIYQDPQAADDLFKSGAPITMVGLDVTMRSILRLEDTAGWRLCGHAGQQYADIVDYYIHIHDEIAPHLQGCPLHDPSAVAAALHPEFFTTLSLFMSAETQGPSIGRTIGQCDQLQEKTPNVQVCVGVNSKALLKHMNDALLRLFNK